MKVSILKESKLDDKGREVESRVVLTPGIASELKKKAPQIELLVETNAGIKIDHPDSDYENIGAKIVSHDEALSADLILGVKETKKEDFSKLSNKSIFMSYQHFAQNKERFDLAINSKATFVCFETMEKQVDGRRYFPCLAPMSEAAARIVVRHADWFALSSKKIIGSGLSQTGFKKLKVTIVGAGSAGKTAAHEFGSRGYEVHIVDKVSLSKLKASIKDSFFVVSSMYTAGASPQKLITKELLNTMMPNGCAYPIDIDQGGGIEGATITSILEPFNLPKIEGTNIYCSAPPNIPSLGARTTSEALAEAILPYLIYIVSLGLKKASEENSTIKSGINVENGKVLHEGLASVF